MKLDTRTLLIMLAAALIGLAWASYNFISTGGARTDETLRPLIWTVFATPFALFLGWLFARRSEWRLAAFCCFCMYFLTFFVAARIEALFYTAEQSAAAGHAFYFTTSLVLHGLTALGLSLWRATRPSPILEPAETMQRAA
jgi:cytochrome bd-type quinol oxidase subunit 2